MRAQLKVLPTEISFDSPDAVRQRQAASAWAYHVLLTGRIPFYSHARDNPASEALAQGLGLTPYAEGAAFD
jgi:hypothetical protein